MISPVDRLRQLEQTVKDKRRRKRENGIRRRHYAIARRLGFDSYMAEHLSGYSVKHIREFAR